MSLLLTIHLAATLFMTGLIWFVQVVHYPLLACIPADEFSQYEKGHKLRTTFIVAPVMGFELLSALALVFMVDSIWLWINLLLNAAIWLLTAFVQVPLHVRLERGFDRSAINALVRSNWLRTALWTGRAVLLTTLL